MANVKISALALIAGASISATDRVVLVDDIGGTPTTYSATMAEQRSGLLKAVGAGWDATDYLTLGGVAVASGRVRVGQGAITADDPLINSTVTWNALAVTFRHILVNVTDTASASTSLFADFQIGGVSRWKVDKGGSVTQGGALTSLAGTSSLAALTVSGTTGLQALTATSGAFSAGLTASGGLAVTGVSTLTAAAAAPLVLGRTEAVGGSLGFIVFSRNGGSKFTIGSTTADGFALYNSALAQTLIVTDPGVVTIGAPTTTSAAAGELVLANAKALRGAIVAGTDTYALINLDASNRVALGQSGVNTITLGSLTVSTGLTVTGNSTITGTLGGITTLSLNNAAASGIGNQFQVADRTTGSETHAFYADAHSGRLYAAGAGDVLTWSYTTGNMNVAHALSVASVLTVASGGIAVTGNSTITGTLGGISTLSATTGTFTGTVAAASVQTTNQAAFLLTNNGNNDVWLNAAGANFRILNNGGAGALLTVTQAGVVSSLGGITAPSFVGLLFGNASTATTLQTARAINGVNFDGSAAITVTAAAGTLTGATLAAGVTASSLTSVGILASPHMTGPIVDSGVVNIGNGITTSAASGDVVLANAKAIRGINSVNTDTKHLISFTAGDLVSVGNGVLLVSTSYIQSTGNVIIQGASTTGSGSDLLLGRTTATTASAGANGAVPAQVAGYLVFAIGPTSFKFPYFNT